MIPRYKRQLRKSDFFYWLKTCFYFQQESRTDAEKFEKELASFLSAKHTYTLPNVYEAIKVTLGALNIMPGDEILLPAYYNIDLISYLKKHDYKITLVDVNSDTFCMSSEDLEKKISANSKAVFLVHMFGAVAEVDKIIMLARAYGAHVIEDASLALGASFNGRSVGTLGDVAFFSFSGHGPLYLYDGAAIVTNDDRIGFKFGEQVANRDLYNAPILKKMFIVWIQEFLLRSWFYGIIVRIVFSKTFKNSFERLNCCMKDKFRVRRVGFSSLQARMGLERLARVREYTQTLNDDYDRLVECLPSGISAQVKNRDGVPSFSVCVLKSDLIEFSELRRRLFKCGIDIGLGSEFMDDCSSFVHDASCVEARNLYSKAFCFPLYENLKEKEFRRLVNALHRIGSMLPKK